MASSEGNLLNSPGNLVLDTLLSVSIIIAYSFQISRIYRHGTRGISPYYVLFNTILSNAQLANVLFISAYGYPSQDHDRSVLRLIGSGQLKGAAAFGAILGIIQVFLQWASSIIIIIMYEKGSEDSRTWIATLAFMHAALFLFPTIVITFPKPKVTDFGIDIFMGLLQILNRFLNPISILLLFRAQYLELQRSSGNPKALSVPSLGLQALVMAVVAIRWMMRMGVLSLSDAENPPNNPWYSMLWWLDYLQAWYSWWLLPITYILYAVASGMLWFAYMSVDHQGGSHVSETEPLLG